MSRIFALAVLALLSVAAGQCYSQCRFRFCYYTSKFYAPKADVSFSGPICAKYASGPIGIVGQTGEAKVVTYKHGFTTLTPISKYHPYGLKQKFSPSFFKSYTRFVKYGPVIKYLKNSGAGRENFQQNQKYFINGRCVVLPLKAWQVLKPNGDVKHNIVSYDPLDCVAFSIHA